MDDFIIELLYDIATLTLNIRMSTENLLYMHTLFSATENNVTKSKAIKNFHVKNITINSACNKTIIIYSTQYYILQYTCNACL